MSQPPLVSILALCYNHALYLDEALLSIENLSYKNIEVWIADDASTDHSAEILRKWQIKRPDWHFHFQETNQGNCRTFNQLLANCTGKWVIDFATDDLLEENALERWVASAESQPDIGFCYADGTLLQQETGEKTRFSQTVSRKKFPEGKILPELLHHPFICPPAVLFLREALVSHGGYDENLSYEDWDIWLRLARDHRVKHHSETVVTYRKHAESLSSSLLLKRNRHLLQSTVRILERISKWSEFTSEPSFLASFIRYHLRLSFALQLPDEARLFYQLLASTTSTNFVDFLLLRFSGKMPFVYPLYKLYQKVKSS